MISSLPVGMQSFITYTEIPIGSNTFDKTSAAKAVLNKTSTANAAIQIMDMGRLPSGTHISFSVDVRCTTLTAGSASIEIDSRSGPTVLNGRKIVGLANTTSTEWTTLRTDWIVADGGNWISIAYGAGTASQGVFEFRNPRMSIDGARYQKSLAFNLQRVSSVWSIDTTNFTSSGAYLVSATGDTITVSWPGFDESRAPIVTISVDTGFGLVAAGFIAAGANSVTKDGCKIKLIKTDGTFATDVTSGGTVRLHVNVSF